ncbi:MAG: DNA topoisomerase III [Eubacteriales bacterium]|nr:DNA topoisomerase III [Eubacteriales bacterium]
MSKNLVLAEKPSVGREIARHLNCRQNRTGYMEGDNYIVTWALGHLVTLAEPEHYGEKYKTWSLDTLPMLPDKMELTVIGQTSKQFGVVRGLMHRPDVSALIIATDAGREGELVARWIIAKAGFYKSIKRLWISSQTDRALKEGFAKLKNGSDYEDLYRSAVCRAQADWLVGLNVTRALTCHHNARLSAGRVQTPTLAIITEREKEIRLFRPKEYYNIRADLAMPGAGHFFAVYRDKSGQTAVWDKTEAERVAAAVKGGRFRVAALSASDRRIPPPALYDLTELQRDANKIHGLSAKHTLDVMQQLYERYKVLTYPRTDSRYLTDDIIPTLQERVRAASTGELAPFGRECKIIHRSCINNAGVRDHHAIIPTEVPADLSAMNADEKKIYLLVAKRFFANFMPDCTYRRIKVELRCEGMDFSAAGREAGSPGWKKVYTGFTEEDEEDGEPDQSLPAVNKGDEFPCDNIQFRALKTTPPPRYTEATLLSVMENPSKFITDTKMKEFIGGGLGTPATRADIIEKLFASFYIEKQGNYLVPTSKAEQLISLVPPDLREPVLTAEWEKKLDAISRGKADHTAFISEIKNYTTSLVSAVVADDTKYVHDNMTREVCPECGKFLLNVKGKKGTMLVCQDRECSYRRNVIFKSNVRCPECHKTMEVFGEGEKRTYACVCGFRERVERFHEQRKTSGASKSDVRAFIEKQKKQETPGESAFAAALRKAMEEKSDK